MKKKYYIYSILIGLFIILCILYIKYNNIIEFKNNNIKANNINNYILDKKPEVINNTNITKSNNF